MYFESLPLLLLSLPPLVDIVFLGDVLGFFLMLVLYGLLFFGALLGTFLVGDLGSLGLGFDILLSLGLFTLELLCVIGDFSIGLLGDLETKPLFLSGASCRLRSNGGRSCGAWFFSVSGG